jgi:hypothetical protein
VARDLDREIRVRVGQTLIAIEVPDWRLARRMRDHFSVAPFAGHPDIVVHLSLKRTGVDGIVDSLFEEKSVDGECFEIGGGIVRGCYRREQGDVEVQADERLFSGRMIRVFEQLLYQVFFSDPRNRNGRILLLHSSGVVSEGAGFVFTGSSGAGKSTIAALSSRDTVLNDEICLVRFHESETILESTPFNGFFRRKSEGNAPLRCVFVLHQAKAHAVRPMGRGEAVAALLPQLVPVIGMDERITRDTLRRMLDLAAELQRRVPVRRLEFARDAGFWEKIDDMGELREHGGEA